MKNYLKRKRKVVLVVFLTFLLVLPNLVFVSLDKTYWGWDESTYGDSSIILFQELVNRPTEWLDAMVNVFPRKAPMLFWLGEFFVPLGSFFGSMDIALRLMLLISQTILLLLLFKSGDKIFHNGLISAIACLAVSMSPLYIRYSTIFMVELLQILTVVWFIYIFASLRQWDSLSVILHSVAALAFGQLVKTSTIMYTIAPLMFIGFYVIKKRMSNIKWKARQHLLISVVAVLLSSTTVIYYVKNVKPIYQGVRFAASSPMWGTQAPFLKKLIVWWHISDKSFFMPNMVFLFLALILIGILVSVISRRVEWPDAIAFVSLIQISIVFAINSLATNTIDRFILGILPYVVILTCWGLYKLNLTMVNVIVMFVVVCQFTFINLVRFDFLSPTPAFAQKYQKVDRIGDEREAATKIYSCLAPFLCRGATICAVRLGKVWIDNRVKYYLHSAKHLLCDYDTKLNIWSIMPQYIVPHDKHSLSVIADKYWERIHQEKPQYYLTPTREFLLRKTDWQWVLPNELALKLLDRVEANGLYEEIHSGTVADFGFAIYRLKLTNGSNSAPKEAVRKQGIPQITEEQKRHELDVLKRYISAKRYSEANDLAKHLLEDENYHLMLTNDDIRNICWKMFSVNKNELKDRKRAIYYLNRWGDLGGRDEKVANYLRTNFSDR